MRGEDRFAVAMRIPGSVSIFTDFAAEFRM